MKTIAVIMMMCLGVLCMADNMLVNGDMKNNKGWVIWGSAPKDAALRSQILTYVNEGPQGERVLKFSDDLADYNPYLVQHVPVSGVTAAQKYKLELKAKLPAGKKFYVMIQMVGGKKFLGASRGVNFAGTGDWKEYECVFTGLNLEATMLTVAIFPFWPNSNKADTASILIRDAELELED